MYQTCTKTAAILPTNRTSSPKAGVAAVASWNIWQHGGLVPCNVSRQPKNATVVWLFLKCFVSFLGSVLCCRPVY